MGSWVVYLLAFWVVRGDICVVNPYSLRVWVLYIPALLLKVVPIERPDTLLGRCLDVYKHFILKHTHLNGSAGLFPSEATQLIKLVSLQKKIMKYMYKKRWMISFLSFPIRSFQVDVKTASCCSCYILDQFRLLLPGCPPSSYAFWLFFRGL